MPAKAEHYGKLAVLSGIKGLQTKRWGTTASELCSIEVAGLRGRTLVISSYGVFQINIKDGCFILNGLFHSIWEKRNVGFGDQRRPVGDVE